jgi:hypothetical protein
MRINNSSEYFKESTLLLLSGTAYVFLTTIFYNAIGIAIDSEPRAASIADNYSSSTAYASLIAEGKSTI